MRRMRARLRGFVHASLHLAVPLAVLAEASLARAQSPAAGARMVPPPPAPVAAAPRSVPSFALDVERVVLDNGLEILLEENHRSPLVALQVAYKAGAKHDPKNRRGLAYLVGLLVADPSTRHVGRTVAAEMYRALKAEAFRPSVDTNVERTTVSYTFPSNQLELALWTESDRMGFGLDGMDLATILQKRDRIDAARRAEDERPYGALDGIVRQAMFPADHPYRAGVLGSGGDLASVTHADVKAFVKTHYAPNNATLVLVGDFDKTKVKELLKKYFGPIVRGPAVAKVDAPPVTFDGERHVPVVANVERPRLLVSWSTPPLFADGDIELDVTYQVLTGTAEGRLKRRLLDLKLATEVTTRQRSSALASRFDVDVTLAPGVTHDRVLRVVDEELDKLRAAAPTEAEVDVARQRLLRQTAFPAETFAGRAQLIGYYHHYSGDAAKLVNEYLARYAAVTPEALRKAVSTHLPPKKRIVLTVTHSSSAPRGGKAEGN